MRSGLESLEQRRLLSITEHTLVYPLDAGPWDTDSDAAEVSVAMTLKYFDVQLYDADGIKDSTVHSQDVDLYKKVSGQWVQQTDGTDYTLSYDAGSDAVTLTSKLSGNKFPIADYKIFVDGSGIQDNNNNNVADKTIYPSITANEAVIAVIPDSQKMTLNDTDALKFNTETQFIVDNLGTDNIQFVTHVGDVVDSSSTGAQWTRAFTAMNKLNDLEKTGGPNYENGLLPYGVSPGNHDYDSSEHFSAKEFVRNFGAKRYAGLDWYGGTSEGTVADELNHYQIFEACGYQFLHITLEREARDASLAWAQRVVETHPDLPVILSTHSYLTTAATLSTEKISKDPTCNSGQDIWNEFIKKNDQIFLVFCGHNHMPDAKLWSDTNLAQHTVYGALIDFQNLTGGDMNQFEYVYLRPDSNRIDLKYVDPDTGTKTADGGWDMTFSTRLSFSGVAPKARLLAPVDNGPDDNDSDADEVKVHARQAEFVIQLSDVGEGIDDSTVTSGTVSVQRNGTTLTQGTDYSVSYDSAEDRITLTPVGRTDFQIGSYTVTLNGGASKIEDKGDNQLAQKSFTIVIDPAASSTILAIGAPAKAFVPTADPGNTDWREKLYWDDNSWRIGHTGVAYDTAADYQYDNGLDVLELRNNPYSNNSVYVRVKFDLPTDPAEIDTLTLKIKCDDGFAAWLNAGDTGNNHTVASARAPNPLNWNSASTSSHDATWETIDISAHKDHLKRGLNLLTIQGLNVNTTSTDFLILPQITATYKDAPRADLTGPLDNGSGDLDPRQTWAIVASASSFTVQLSDLSHQIDDNTVVTGTVTLKRGGTTLTAGTDYDFQYTTSTDVIQLTPHSGGSFTGGTYDIILNGGASKIKDNASPTPAEMPRTSFTVEVSSLADDVTLVATNASVKYKVPTAAISNWNTQSFDDSAWSSGTLGVGYDKLGDYASLIGTDVAASMYDTNPSMYIRAKYDLANPDVAHLYRLNIQHDDGFVAYVNGTLAAFKNPPLKAAAWDSATERISHDESAADQTETYLFTVHGPNDGEPLNYHLDNVLAIQVFNLSKASSDLLVLPELVVVTDAPKWTYTFTGGVLTINGTADADTLVVSSETINGEKWVKVGEDVLVSPRVPAADVQEIVVYGNGGNDAIDLSAVTTANGFSSSLNGNVTVEGGAGVDTITGSAFNDYLTAGTGDDEVHGGPGNDTITGSDGPDQLYGDAGNDLIYGMGGADLIYGGADNDEIYAGSEGWQGTGNSTLYGEAGNDTLFADNGNDSMLGGTGDDDYYVATGGATGSKKVDETGGGGTGDRIVLKGIPQGVTFDMALTSVQDLTGSISVQIVVANSIEKLCGTDYADLLYGTDNADDIDGGGTQGGYTYDTIYGRSGNDVIWSDTSWLNSDNGIIVYGDGGNDTICGTLGYDRLYGGAGDDSIYGYSLADSIEGNDGNDVLYGAYTSEAPWVYDLGDTLLGGAGDDTIYGGPGNDQLGPGAGTDYLYGGTGDDLFDLGSGYGGSGTKYLYEYTDEGTTDHVSLYGLSGGATFDLSSTAGQPVPGSITIYLNNGSTFEYLTGTAYADTLTGNDRDNNINGAGTQGGNTYDTMSGRTGNDVLWSSTHWLNSDNGIIAYGEDGNDTICGTLGYDRLYGGYGDDSIYGYSWGDYIDGGAGNDVLYGAYTSEVPSVTDANDTILGGDGDDTIYGHDGDDSICGNGGADVLYGEDGSDTLLGGGGADQAFGGAGADFIDLGADDDTAYGGDGNDTIIGSELADLIYGEAGDDSISALGGNDTVDGGTGNDTIYGGDGNDSLLGGAGNDAIYGQAGNDTIEGGTGNDTLNGYTGDDTFVFSGTGLGSDSITETASYGGTDVLDFAGFGGTVSLNLGSTSSQTVNASHLTLTLSDGSAIENVVGSAYADNITGNSLNNKIWGGYADDTIDGSSGDDSLYGEAGADRLYGGYGNDRIDGGDGNDVVYGGSGNDYIWGMAGNDSLFGEDGDDTIDGGYGNDLVYAGNGNDLVYLTDGTGGDYADGGAGNDTLYYNNGDSYGNFESTHLV